MTIEELRQYILGVLDNSIGIRDEQRLMANTAKRVGGNLGDITEVLKILFADYLNQSVKTDSDVQFRDLLIRSFRSLNFAAGPLGAGVGMVEDNELQTDRLLVRKLMFVLELAIQKIRHQGGILILSPASMKIFKVVNGGSYWKCFFENDGGNIANEFVVDDQAKLQNFSGNNIKYLWAKVTAIGTDFVHLSKTDKEGDGIPEEGDDLVQLGHRTNPDRQDATMLSAVNGEVGIITYHGINGFDLSGKEGSWLGKHGGKRGAVIRGEVHITAGSTGLKELDEFQEVEKGIQDAQQTADEAIAKAVKVVQVTASPSQVFKYGAGYVGVPIPASIVLSVTVKNFMPVSYQWQYLSGSTWTNISGATSVAYSVAPNNLTLFPNGENVRSFRCVCDGDINLSDSFTIAKLADGTTGPDGKPGADACTVLLTNETHTIACDSSGNPLSGELAKATTKIMVYKGSVEVSFVLQNLVAVGGTFVVDGTDGVKCTALTSDSGGCTFEVKIGSIVVKKVFGVTKAKAGAQGATGPKGDTGPVGSQGIPGTSQYFHVKYSANATGNPMVDTPNTYIGTAVTTSATPPTGYASYKWVQLQGSQGAKGDQGIQGPVGANGVSSYLHIKYSDNGTTFTANNGETPGQWIGQYVDTIPADSITFSAYTWTKVKGEKGDTGATGATGPKGDTGPTGSQGIPGTSQYFHVKYSANATGNPMVDTPNTYIGTAVTTSATPPTGYASYKWVQLQGSQGAKGDQGIQGPVGANGVSSYLHIKYSDNGTTFTANNGETPGQWIGQYVDTIPADSITFSAYTWTKVKGEKGDTGATGATGPKGDTGPTGSQGIPGTSQYFHVKYSANATGNPMVDTPNTYIGTAVTTSATPPTGYASYKWVQLQGSQGAKGDQGIQGPVGANGVSSYLHIKYSDNGTTFTANNGETPGQWIGQYVDTTLADSMTFSAYTWTKVKGDKGDTGAQGIPGESISGKMLYKDLEFKVGTNMVGVYNNSSNGTVTVARIDKPSDAPTSSSHCLQVKTAGTASPDYGGVVQSIQSRANAVFIQRIIAKIPVGYTINAASNSMGTGYTDTWLTSRSGTGKYETYLRKVVCGATGSFSSGGHVYLSGSPAPTASAPLVWYIASMTCYDQTVDGYSDIELVTKDSFAGQMGYTSFQNMIDQTVAKGGKLVVDGLLNANLINVNVLAANTAFIDKLRTNILTASTIKANMLSVAGFTFQDNQIYGGGDFGTGPGVKITSTTAERSFKAYKDTANHVSMYYNNASDWGLKGLVGGKTVFQLGTINRIGGFLIENNYLRYDDVSQYAGIMINKYYSTDRNVDKLEAEIGLLSGAFSDYSYMAAFRNMKVGIYGTAHYNVGLIASADGASASNQYAEVRNLAIWAPKGDIKVDNGSVYSRGVHVQNTFSGSIGYINLTGSVITPDFLIGVVNSVANDGMHVYIAGGTRGQEIELLNYTSRSFKILRNDTGSVVVKVPGQNTAKMYFTGATWLPIMVADTYKL